MKRAENLNAPSLNGLLIAGGFGVLAFAVAKVVGGFDYTPAGFFGLLVAAGAAAFLVIPWGGNDRIPAAEADTHHAPAAAPAAAASAAPAALMAAPAAAAAAAAAPAKPAAVAAAASGDVAVLDAPAKPAKAKAPAAKTAAAKPAAAAEPVAAEGTRPKALKAARKGQADDLKKLEGIGPAMEKLCNELGIFHFDQIAAWGPAEVAWMDANLKGFKGRVSRDKWVAQARLIGEVGMDEFLRRAKTNDY